MKETESLLARAEKYLSSSKVLIREQDYESAVSRAYYAMFYAAEAILLSDGVTCSSHKAVISNFCDRYVKSGPFEKELGREFHRAYGKRQLSDYEYICVISLEEAIQIRENAINFVKQISTHLSSYQS